MCLNLREMLTCGVKIDLITRSWNLKVRRLIRFKLITHISPESMANSGKSGNAPHHNLVDLGVKLRLSRIYSTSA